MVFNAHALNYIDDLHRNGGSSPKWIIASSNPARVKQVVATLDGKAEGHLCRIFRHIHHSNPEFLVRFCSASHFIIRGCLLSVPCRKALPNMGRAFQFVDHRDGVILN